MRGSVIVGRDSERCISVYWHSSRDVILLLSTSQKKQQKNKQVRQVRFEIKVAQLPNRIVNLWWQWTNISSYFSIYRQRWIIVFVLNPEAPEAREALYINLAGSRPSQSETRLKRSQAVDAGWHGLGTRSGRSGTYKAPNASKDQFKEFVDYYIQGKIT